MILFVLRFGKQRNEIMNERSTIIFKALSDPNRLRILKVLQGRILCACEVKDVFGLAGSTISQHMSILREAGFITEEKKGKWVHYSINMRPSDPRVSSILSMLDYWIQDDELVSETLKAVPPLKDTINCCKTPSKK